MKTKEEINQEIGKRIQNIRKQQGMSRRQFAEKCGISESFLSSVERGEKSITTKNLYHMCRNVGVSSDTIVFGDSREGEYHKIADILQDFEEEQCRDMIHVLEEVCRVVRKNNG